jgi:hypothetical protein
MDFTELALSALQILSPVLLAGLTWLAARVAALIRVRIESEYLRGALIRLDDAILTATKELQQTVVAEVKAAAADGKITPAERERIKRTAVTNAKSHLGPRGIAEIARVLGLPNGALDDLIGSKVEAAVHDLRLAANGHAANGVAANGNGGPAPAAPAG